MKTWETLEARDYIQGEGKIYEVLGVCGEVVHLNAGLGRVDTTSKYWLKLLGYIIKQPECPSSLEPKAEECKHIDTITDLHEDKFRVRCSDCGTDVSNNYTHKIMGDALLPKPEPKECPSSLEPKAEECVHKYEYVYPFDGKRTQLNYCVRCGQDKLKPDTITMEESGNGGKWKW